MLKGSVMSLASSSRVGEVSSSATLKFLLFKTILGHGDVFEEVSERDLQPRDLLLFPWDSSSGYLSNTFKHAAVYCGDREIIQFLSTCIGSISDMVSGRRTPGLISKEGFETVKSQLGQCRIYRKKGGGETSDFQRKVRKAMNSEAEYNAFKSNCIHFALSLLGLEELYSKLVQIQDEGDSSSSGAAI
ncbi:hypothetical protein Q9966_004893 [Columba livia]|nr:hypothetical protein Q9966_004893 [Columba livia]